MEYFFMSLLVIAGGGYLAYLLYNRYLKARVDTYLAKKTSL